MIRHGAVAGPVAGALCLASITVAAHKPITSKYTYNEHVFPILRAHCSACHVDGGVAPMSLMTYADAYPWAESIRAELIAGHMPPWPANDGRVKLRGRDMLSPRDLDTVITWATGGTPEGPASAKPAPVALHNEWRLGPPDLVIDVPEAVTLRPGEMATTREFELPPRGVAGRRVRAVDLLPGTPAVVRRATIQARSRSAGEGHETMLALWLPGGAAAGAPDGAAFDVPSDATLVATITYRKTWKYENEAVTDRSRVGVYFAAPTARAIAAIRLGDRSVTLDRDADVVAIRINASDPDKTVDVDAIGDGTVRLITATTAPEWPRRFWLAEPLRLRRGTRLTVGGEGAEPVVDVVY